MKTQWPKHIGMSRREFMRAKKRVLKCAILAFDCRERDADCADDLITGAGYLPDDVCRDIHARLPIARVRPEETQPDQVLMCTNVHVH